MKFTSVFWILTMTLLDQIFLYDKLLQFSIIMWQILIIFSLIFVTLRTFIVDTFCNATCFLNSNFSLSFSSVLSHAHTHTHTYSHTNTALIFSSLIPQSVKASVCMYTYQNERDTEVTKSPKTIPRRHSYSGSRHAGTMTTISDLRKNHSTGLWFQKSSECF